MKTSKAMEGFLLDFQSSGKSAKTAHLYSVCLNCLIRYLRDPEVNTIQVDDFKRFMLFMRQEYKPNRPDKKQNPGLSI
jgi:hypothetical protein